MDQPNIRDMVIGETQRRGLITVTVAESVWGDDRWAWHFGVETRDRGIQALVWEQPDVSLYHNDSAILSVVAARLWVGGKNSNNLLADGRSFISISSDQLWAQPPGGTLES